MKRDRVYLLHIRDSIRYIGDDTAEGREAFFADRKTQDAVIRNLEIIGEAVKNLSDALKQANPGIPWRQIAGMRDVLIHHYFGVTLETVWRVVEDHLPTLSRKVDDLLAETGPV